MDQGAARPEGEGLESSELTEAQQNPVAFSYRLGANLPLDDNARQQLLSTDSLVHR
jgi:hypothetical protein